MLRAFALGCVVLECLIGCGSARVSSTREISRSAQALMLAASAAAPPPLYLEVWATVHGTSAGAFHSDIVLHSGDRIALQARTSIAANVVLLHCDPQQVLSVFPESGALQFLADRRISLPASGMDIRLNGSPGRETLYIVASRRPLIQADPGLHAALAPGDQRACRDMSARPAKRSAVRGIEVSRAQDSVARAFAGDDGVIVLRFPFQHLP